MKYRFVDNATIGLPDGFYYIPQDNYYIANLNEPNPDKPAIHLYSDSATSCIIVIVEGKDRKSNPLIALTHLSRKERFLRFFEIVGENFHGPVSVFCQGANPSFAAASKENSNTLLQWICRHRKKQDACYIEHVTLSMGLGDPQVDNRGCYGIDLNTMVVSNRRYALTNQDRDPKGGVQTLFCVFGLEVEPKIVLPRAGQDFTDDQIKRLVDKAKSENWTKILYMTQEEVLNKYSSTPQYEAPWFYSTLRESALFVKNYK